MNSSPLTEDPRPLSGPFSADEVGEMLRPGATISVDINTTARLVATIAIWQEECGGLSKLVESQDEALADLETTLAERDARLRELGIDALRIVQERDALREQLDRAMKFVEITSTSRELIQIAINALYGYRANSPAAKGLEWCLRHIEHDLAELTAFNAPGDKNHG